MNRKTTKTAAGRVIRDDFRDEGGRYANIPFGGELRCLGGEFEGKRYALLVMGDDKLPPDDMTQYKIAAPIVSAAHMDGLIAMLQDCKRTLWPESTEH